MDTSPLRQDLQASLDNIKLKTRTLFEKLAKQNPFEPHEFWKEIDDTKKEAKVFFEHWLTDGEIAQDYPFPMLASTMERLKTRDADTARDLPNLERSTM